MTQAALKFATAMNYGVEVQKNPLVIPAWIAKEMGDPEVLLFESQRAYGQARYKKRLERLGKGTGKKGRPRTKLSEDDHSRLSQTLKAYLEATK